MKRSRQLSRALLASCACLAVALTAGLTAATAKPNASVTLQFVTTNTIQPAFQVLIANFNRVYPDIQINATYLPSDQYNSLIPTQLAAGNAPDLFTAFPGTGALPSTMLMANAGYLADLADRPWAKRVPTVAKPLISNGKKLFAWPLGASAYFLMYNKTAFSQLGLKPTSTFSGLQNLCHKIRAAGKIPLVQAGGVGPNNGIAVLQLAAGTVYAANPNWNADRAAGKVTFAGTPGWGQALQEIADLNKDGCFEPGVQSVSVPAATAMFANGQALMWICNSQNIGLVRAINPTMDLGVMATPGRTAKAQITMVAYPSNLVVNAHSPNLSSAKTFVDFMARSAQSSLWAKVGGYTAPLDATQGKLSPDIASLAPFFSNSLTRANPLFTWPNGVIFSTLGADVQGLFTGQKTVAQILADLDSAWNTPT